MKSSGRNKNRIKLLFVILRITFGLIFIFSSIIKLTDLQSFEKALASFNLLDTSLLPITIYAIPLIELLLGLAMVFSFKTNVVSQIITFMLALFTAVVIAKIFEGAEISCGCFGELSNNNIDSFTVIRNVFLMIWGILITIYYQNIEEEKMKIKNFTKQNLIRSIKTNIYEQIKSVVLVTIFFFLGVQTVIFAIQNRELKVRLALLTTDKDILKEGDKVKPFKAVDLRGNVAEINYNIKKKTLIYILSTRCKPCKKNMPNWIELTNKLKNQNVRILGIALNSLTEIKKYAADNKLNFSVYIPPNEIFKINYKAFLTPQTLLINNKAKTIKSIPGILNKNTISDLVKKIE
ncbi:thiol-disulfide oxidoreductase ResA [bacterium BMS3Abin04]|nr:thiol-disulfide oxidoreductase ResA [bacterium BMS3Abin04]